jgi:hypothetical protein
MSNLTENRSLINLAMDLIELDPTAPENKETIEGALSALGQKVEAYVAVDKFADSQIEMLKKEVEFLQAQVKKYEKLQDKLRERADMVMKQLGVRSLKGPNGHKFAYHPSWSVEIEDESLLPKWAYEDRTTRHVKKTQIKEAIKSGQEINGAKLVVRDNVQLK